MSRDLVENRVTILLRLKIIKNSNMVESSCNRELNNPVEILKVEEPSEDLIRVEDNDKFEYNGELEYGELKDRMEILRRSHRGRR